MVARERTSAAATADHSQPHIGEGFAMAAASLAVPFRLPGEQQRRGVSQIDSLPRQAEARECLLVLNQVIALLHCLWYVPTVCVKKRYNTQVN